MYAGSGSRIFKRMLHKGIQSDLRISDRASSQLNEINASQKTSHFLRVQVDNGGCHGFQYKIDTTEKTEKDDILFEHNDAKVLIDPITLDMIRGSTLDYLDELIGSSFQIVGNPNAESSCGCKISFNIKQ
jgi:iron-sulfur cluster assembly accessory protein